MQYKRIVCADDYEDVGFIIFELPNGLYAICSADGGSNFEITYSWARFTRFVELYFNTKKISEKALANALNVLMAHTDAEADKAKKEFEAMSDYAERVKSLKEVEREAERYGLEFEERENN